MVLGLRTWVVLALFAGGLSACADRTSLLVEVTSDFTIPDVPAGRYMLSAWHERYGPPTADAFPREVTISDANPTLGVIRLVDDGKAIAPHKNKYGRDYNPPSPGVPTYK